MEEKIVYFEEPGAENTETTLRLAMARAKDRGIKKIVLASTRGDTAHRAAELWAGTGIKIIAVPWQYGFKEEPQRFPAELIAEFNKQGHAVYFGTMLFHTTNLYGTETPHLMADLLRTFSQGIKVCVEITLMVTDGGHVAPGEDVVVVAGTGRGADTAVVASAAPSIRFQELHIREIICKPFQNRTRAPSSPPPPPPPPHSDKKI